MIKHGIMHIPSDWHSKLVQVQISAPLLKWNAQWRRHWAVVPCKETTFSLFGEKEDETAWKDA